MPIATKCPTSNIYEPNLAGQTVFSWVWLKENPHGCREDVFSIRTLVYVLIVIRLNLMFSTHRPKLRSKLNSASAATDGAVHSTLRVGRGEECVTGSAAPGRVWQWVRRRGDKFASGGPREGHDILSEFLGGFFSAGQETGALRACCSLRDCFTQFFSPFCSANLCPAIPQLVFLAIVTISLLCGSDVSFRSRSFLCGSPLTCSWFF